MHNDSHMKNYQFETPYYQPLAPISTYAVAQGLAQLFHKQEVVGSNPLLPTYHLVVLLPFYLDLLCACMGVCIVCLCMRMCMASKSLQKRSELESVGHLIQRSSLLLS